MAVEDNESFKSDISRGTYNPAARDQNYEIEMNMDINLTSEENIKVSGS